MRTANEAAQDWRRAFPPYLRAAMDRAGIRDAAALGKLSGINRSVIGRWLQGSMQPSIRQLRAVAKPLHVPAIRLYIVAGHVEDEEIRLPPEEVPAPIAPEEQIRARLARKPELLRVVLAALEAASSDERTPPTAHNRRRVG